MSLKKLRDSIFAAARDSVPSTNPLCPKCKKARMSPRHGTRGWFWGCSHFPYCRGAMGMSAADRKREARRRGDLDPGGLKG